MNKFAFVLVLTLPFVAGVTHAKTANETVIAFAKGSNCGSFQGQSSAKKPFTLNLAKGQWLYIETSDDIVKILNPKGASVSYDYDSAEGKDYFRTTLRGKYKIYLSSDSGFTDATFCAY